MKARFAAVAAVAATGAYAQSMSSSQSISYMTVTYDDCPSSSMETMITVTKGTTITYCPMCEMTPNSAGQEGYTTTYTTVYMSLCPTGTVPATYTITESCIGATPTWTPGPSHIPQGFTVTTKECSVCGETPSTVTITEPCGCEAHEGTPVGNGGTSPTSPSGNSGSGSGSPGGSGGSGGSGPAGNTATPTGGSGSGSGGSSPSGCTNGECGGSESSSSPAGSGSGSSPNGSGSGSSPNGWGSGSSPSGFGAMPSESCNGECGGSDNQSGPSSMGGWSPSPGGSVDTGAGAPPYPTTATEMCPGPQCRAAATSGRPTGVSYGNTAGITQVPPNMGSSISSLTIASTIGMAVAVAVLAFAL